MEIVRQDGEFIQPDIPEILPPGVYFITIKMGNLEQAMSEVQNALNSSQFIKGRLVQIVTQLVPGQSSVMAKPELLFYVCAVVEMK